MPCLDYYTPPSAPWSHRLLVCYPAGTNSTSIEAAITNVGSSVGTYSSRGGYMGVLDGPPPTGRTIATINDFNGGTGTEYAKAVWTALKNAGLDSVVTGIVQDGVDVPKPTPTYTPTISVSPTTIPAGTNFTVTGSGFNPALPVDVFTTDLYGNNLQFPASQSPTPQGTLSLKITLNVAITYSGTGYVLAKQEGGIESNHAQISISAAVLPQLRYYTRYVRIDSGTLPASVTFFVQDLTANTYLSQDLLTIATLGKKLCFKGSATVYDSHRIRFRVRNSGASTISVTFGLAYQASAAMGGNAPNLSAGSESAAVDVGTWSIFKSTDFDFAGCEGVGLPPPGSDCDAKFPNRQTNLWEMIGWGVCVGVNAVIVPVLAALQPIFDTISKMLSPFLQPFQDAVTTINGIGTAVSDWIRDPWTKLNTTLAPLVAQMETPLKNYWNWVIASNTQFFKPLTDALAVAQQDFSGFVKILTDWLNGVIPETIKTMEAWTKNPVAEAFKLATPIAEGFYDAANQVFKVADPFAELFNPERFQTKQVQDVVRPIYEVLHQGEFQIFNLYAAIIFAPWINLFNFMEGLTVGTEPATYDAAKARASLMIMISVEINALLTLLRAIGKFAPIIVSSLEGIADGLTQIVAAILAIKSASEIYGPGWRASTLTPLERHWKSIALSERPSPAEYMSMRAEGTITKADYTERMKGAGFSEEWSAKLYDEYLREPSFREFATLYRRRKITQTAFANLYETARLDRKFEHLDPESGSTEGGSVDAWLEQIYNDPTWRQLNVMATSGKLTDTQITELLRAAGTRPEYMDTLKAVLKELPGRTERRRVLTLEARLVALGKLDEAAYYADATTLLTAHEIAELILRAERLRVQTGADELERQYSIGNLNSWYMEDIIDASIYRQDASALTYSDTYIDRQLAYMDKKKLPAEPPVTEREASRAMYDTYYVEDIIDSVAWRAFYVAQKYPTDVIELQLALLDKKKAPPVEPPPPDLETERDLLQSEAIAAFKKHIIDEPTLRDRLDKLGRSDDAINVLVALAKMEMATEQRDATLAVYAKAYRQGAILRSDYLAKLIDNQYMPDAAELIVQTEELSWGTGIEALTAEQTLNAWEQGFQTIEQTTDRLRKAGWTETDMKIRLSFSVIDMLKAKHLTAAEADKLWTDFGLGPEERARLAAWYGGAPA